MTTPATPQTSPLPPARHTGHYDVGLVCLGNICRSPIAHVVLERDLEVAGLGEIVTVASSGTGGWHVGQPMDDRAAVTLSLSGYDPTRHRARQFDAAHWADLDLVLAMDAANVAELENTGTGPEVGRLALFRDLDPLEPGTDVPDPYYGGAGGFEEVLTMVQRTSGALVAALVHQRPWLTTGAAR